LPKGQEIKKKAELCGQVDNIFYIVQKHIKIIDKGVLSERVCARIGKSGPPVPWRISYERKTD